MAGSDECARTSRRGDLKVFAAEYRRLTVDSARQRS
jgi:hypothetical protein